MDLRHVFDTEFNVSEKCNTAGATTDFSWARNPAHGAFDETVGNSDGTNAFTAGMAVMLDTGHLLSGTQTCVGAKMATGAVYCLGIVVDAMAANTAYPWVTGRVQISGRAMAQCGGTTTAGNIQMSNSSGQVVDHTSTSPALGQALTAGAASTDLFLLQIQITNTA